MANAPDEHNGGIGVNGLMKAVLSFSALLVYTKQ